MEDVATDDLFKGKVVLFSVPGAFTPTCSMKHLPGFIEQADAFKAKGVDRLVCLAVNDPFVMKAWADHNNTDGKVEMLPDGSGVFTKALGLELDVTEIGLGMRGQRFALYAVDGIVKESRRRIRLLVRGQSLITDKEGDWRNQRDVSGFNSALA
jgi:peroxiredoxin